MINVPEEISKALEYYQSQGSVDRPNSKSLQLAKEILYSINWGKVNIPIISQIDGDISLTWWNYNLFIIFEENKIGVDGLNDFKPMKKEVALQFIRESYPNILL